MKIMYLAKECGGMKGKPAIPAFTKFGKKEEGWWIRLREDLEFMEKSDEGYYAIKWDGDFGKWVMCDQDGYRCHKNPNKNPEDMNDTGKDGKAGWRIFDGYGDAPAPELIKELTASEVRCYAKPVNPKP